MPIGYQFEVLRFTITKLDNQQTLISITTKLILSYVAALLIASVCGTQYLFSSYSTALADKLGYSSIEINTIGSFANYGVYLSMPVNGYIMDSYGPRKTTLVASILVFFGYFSLAMTYAGYFRVHSFMLCAIYLFLAGAASSAAFGAPLALFGLSAFTFAQIDNLIFKDNVYDLLLFLSITTGSVLFVGGWFLNVIPPPSSSSSLNNDNNDEIVAIDGGEHEHTETSPLLRSPSSSDMDIAGWNFLKNNNAILLTCSIFFLGGVGLMYINNVGTIIKSLYYEPRHPSSPEILQNLQNYHVSLISIFSCLGRISVGAFSDVTKKLFNLRRLWYLILAGTWLLIGNLMTAIYIKRVSDLWIVSVFVGYGFGNLFGVSPTIVSEWFGNKNFGLNCSYTSNSNPQWVIRTVGIILSLKEPVYI
ncbi:3385_t:CDS:2 [Entrophospora sp. SA101]|nr:3385_t:CDS:2 [Entrophospora sp. SA101]